MGKKKIYVILGLIVAFIVIADCLSNTSIKNQALSIEHKISHQIDQVFNN
jgi:hypothetical protein